jgi:hypothetical protein
MRIAVFSPETTVRAWEQEELNGETEGLLKQTEAFPV